MPRPHPDELMGRMAGWCLGGVGIKMIKGWSLVPGFFKSTQVLSTLKACSQTPKDTEGDDDGRVWGARGHWKGGKDFSAFGHYSEAL